MNLPSPLPRRHFLRLGLAGYALWGGPPARACEFFAAHFRITHPWTRASAPGETTAMVCLRIDEVTLSDRLIHVETPVAESAEMGGIAVPGPVNLVIPADRVTQLSEAGPYIRLLGLRHALEVTREYPMDLVFERAGVVQARLSVDYTRFG